MISGYNISSGQRNNSLFGKVDKVALLLYVAIVLLGLLFITSASYDPEAENIFSFSHNYMKQAIWIGISSVVVTVVLLLDRRLFHMFAVPAYVVGIGLLLAALFFGREVNGAKAWFEFGGFRVQPVEFAKIATALMMARVMSDYSFNIKRLVDLVKVAAVILLPFSIIVLQNDTGSGLVLGAFIFVFFTLSALYESWSLPLAIVMGVPLAVMGALCAVSLAHLVAPQFINDIYMQISLAMLIGLAAKNSILVVEYADKLFHEERQSLLDATINASKMRVRPILMTAFASILGMLPLVFASGVYSTARNIMGVSLVGGLLFATIFGVLLYPALYYLVGKVARFEQKRKEENYA